MARPCMPLLVVHQPAPSCSLERTPARIECYTQTQGTYVIEPAARHNLQHDDTFISGKPTSLGRVDGHIYCCGPPTTWLQEDIGNT